MTATAAKPARSKDFIRRDELVLTHLPLVTAIAARIRESLPVHVDLDDLVHSGIVGLLDAAAKYKSDTQVQFTTYARYRVRGAILDSLRDLDCVSRDLRRRQRQMEQVTRDLTDQLDRPPTDTEIAEGMQLGARRWRALQIELNNLNRASAQAQKQENSETPALEPPCPANMHPDRMFARLDVIARLKSAASSLPKRYQQVISLYYESEMNMKDIGVELGVKESRVSQIHKAALTRMQAALQAAGMQSAAG